MALTLEIVTPEARVYSDTIDTVVIPTTQGEIGILPGHLPLLTRVEHGELRVTKGGVTSLLAVGPGFAQIEGDVVSVLAEQAITEDKIDESAVESALKRAEEELKNAPKDSDPSELERLQGAIRFAGVQLGLKRRTKH
jgi:F-type H+-transporting ATPase subunit epsilon